MVGTVVRPDGVSFVGVFVGCSHGGLVDTARKLFGEMESVYRLSGSSSIMADGCSVGKGRAGLIEEAMEMIKGMLMEADAYVWGGVLAGCRISGNVDVTEIAAEHLLALNPGDGGIYSILMTIYATADATPGRWDDDVGIRRSMSDNMTMWNFGCMVDLLGRAGLIEEVMEMIKGMPMEADAYVCGGVLAGCRISGNVDVTEIAVEHLLALNPGDSGIYSILMTIYATTGRWDDAVRIRRSMQDNMTVRIRRSMQDNMTMWNFGFNSIQVEGNIHGLITGTSWTNPLILQFRANLDLKRDPMTFWGNGLPFQWCAHWM